eukprot:Hpha_TRINITY_DN4849_c0_g1::TRINITY_DN4849_c0_g1_i1::g.20324::m.20324
MLPVLLGAAMSGLVAVGGAPAMSRLVVLQRVGERDMVVEVSQLSRHLPDLDPTECGEESRIGRYTPGLKELFHRYNLHFSIRNGSVLCSQVLHGMDPNTATTHHDWLKEQPRGRLGSWFHRPKNEHDGAVLKDEEDVFPLHLPLEVSEVEIEHLDGHRQRLPVTSGRGRRASTVQSLPDPILLDSEGQRAGPTLNNPSQSAQGGPMNLIFVSAGYTSGGPSSSALERFKANVRVGIQNLQFPQDFGLPEADIATARYFSTFNVFAVWQPSNQDGASKPAIGVSVDNNLRCTYGDGTARSPARALYCPRSTVMSIADVAPVSHLWKNTVVIALVNDVDYGGTGVYREGVIKYGTFYNGAMESADPSIQKTGASLLYHELNHAFADLSDEYTVGLTYTRGFNCGPTTTATFPTYGEWGYYVKYNAAVVGQTGYCDKNCAQHPTGLGWEKWLPSQQGNPTTGQVSEVPQEGCYFDNWYRPGTGKSWECLMRALAAPGLCPVCREAGSLQLYTNGMDLTFPACPHPQWGKVWVAASGEASKVIFFVNDRLFGGANVGKVQTSVQWAVDTVVQAGSTDSYFELSASTTNGGLAVGVHRVTAVLRDSSTWVLPDHQPTSMRGVTVEWTVEVVASVGIIQSTLSSLSIPSSQQLGQCTNTGTFHQFLGASSTPGYPRDTTLSGTQYNPYLHYRSCTGVVDPAEAATYTCQCQSRSDCACIPDASNVPRKCELSYVARTYERPGGFTKTADSLEDKFFGVAGGVTVGVLVLLCMLFIVLVCFCDFKREPTAVLSQHFTKPVALARYIMLGAAVLFFLLAAGGLVAWGVLYNRVGVIARMALLIIGGLSVGTLFLAVWGFVAVYYRTLVMLMINGVFLAVAAILVAVAGIYLYATGYPANDSGSDVQEYWRGYWRDGIRDDPTEICEVQQEFECSGWDLPCTQFLTPDNCPVNCEETNSRYFQTCKYTVLKYVHEWFPKIGSCFFVLFYCLASGCVLNFLLYTAIVESDNLYLAKVNYVLDGPLQALFTFINLSADAGTAQHKSKFQRRCLNLFNEFDVDTSGELDRTEFKAFFIKLLGLDPGVLNQQQARPRSVRSFAPGIYAEHQYRGPGVVEKVTESSVTIFFHKEKNTHTYKDRSLARGMVQPGYGPPRVASDFQVGQHVRHAQKGEGQVVGVNLNTMQLHVTFGNLMNHLDSQHLARGFLQPVQYYDTRADFDNVALSEKLEAFFDFFDLDGSGRIERDEWMEVMMLAASMGPEPSRGQYQRSGNASLYEEDHRAWELRSQEFIEAVRQRRETFEEHVFDNREKRLEEIADSWRTDHGLYGIPTEEPEEGASRVQLDAWRLLGRLKDVQWGEAVFAFNALAVGQGMNRSVPCERYGQYLQKRYGTVVSDLPEGDQNLARSVLRELPWQSDYNGNGKMEFSEWLAGFYARLQQTEYIHALMRKAGVGFPVQARGKPAPVQQVSAPYEEG